MHFTHIRRRVLKIEPSSVENLGFEEEHDKPMTLIVDASGLTISKKKEDYILRRRNGYVRKRSLSSCIFVWTKNLKR
jgi:hypothetical protein